MDFKNKAVSPVIATILLLAVTVIIAVGTFQFLQDLSQESLELADNNQLLNDLNTKVIDANEDRAFVQTPYDNLNISKVILDGNECSSNSGIATSKTLELNLSSCSSNVTSSRPQLTIETNEGIIQLQVRELRTQSSSSTSSGGSGGGAPEVEGSMCFDPANINSLGNESPCNGMLIVDRTMLVGAVDISGGVDKAIEYDGINYTFGNSTNNIFTGQVTDMNSLFQSESDFNASIGYWDTRNVTNMSTMFYGSLSFNQPLSNWNTSNVRDTTYMFGCSLIDTCIFNQDISSWDVSSVTDMDSMFLSANFFNQPLNSWDVSGVTDMRFMFQQAISFNQSLNSWNVNNVTHMGLMFYYASSFNQPLNNWSTGNIIDMDSMFSSASSFNQDISNWCVTNIGPPMPTDFDASSGFEGQTALQPQWGTCP